MDSPTDATDQVRVEEKEEAFPPCAACEEMLYSGQENQGTFLDHTCGDV